jgi:hypothetical protein
VGGYTAAENKPWVAKVFLIKYSSICGGSLINKRLVFFLKKYSAICSGSLINKRPVLFPNQIAPSVVAHS